MTVLEQVSAFIARHAPGAVCDDCIATGLGLSVRQHANHKTRELAKDRAFDRHIGECRLCKRVGKTVIRRI